MTYQPAVAVLPIGPRVTTLSSAYLQNNGPAVNPGSMAWPVAKKVIYCPVWLAAPTTAVKLLWINGTVASGNVDCGIYDSAAGLPVNRLVNSGSTAQSGTSVVQSVDSTDTFLAPGLYFLALTMDNITGTIFRCTSSAAFLKVPGWCEETTGSFGLPATATPVALASGIWGLFGFSTVTTI